MAYTLRKAGHSVRVLEKQAALGAPSSGLRVPPNMSKILRKWVGREELAKLSCLNVVTPWYDCESPLFPLTLPATRTAPRVVLASLSSLTNINLQWSRAI